MPTTRNKKQPASSNNASSARPTVGNLKSDDVAIVSEVAEPTKPTPTDVIESELKVFPIVNGSSSFRCSLRPSNPPPKSSLMVFTHGAGGNCFTPAIAEFVQGFEQYKPNSAPDSHISPVISFDGPTNLKSRTNMFHKVTEYCTSGEEVKQCTGGVQVFGGSSMGARAAVIAATEDRDVKKLVLVSYPLIGGKGDIRDQILLDIPEDTEVLFLSGERDNMCDVEKLNGIRKKMNAKSWLVVIEGADHGMNCKPKARTKEMRLVNGSIAAEWANSGEVRSKSGDLGRMEGCKMVMNLPYGGIQSSSQKNPPPAGKEASKRKRKDEPTKQDDAAAATKKATKRKKT